MHQPRFGDYHPSNNIYHHHKRHVYSTALWMHLNNLVSVFEALFALRVYAIYNKSRLILCISAVLVLPRIALAVFVRGPRSPAAAFQSNTVFSVASCGRVEQFYRKVAVSSVWAMHGQYESLRRPRVRQVSFLHTSLFRTLINESYHLNSSVVLPLYSAYIFCGH